MKTIRIEITEQDLPALLAFVGIGTLYAILTNTVSPDVGIWTLAAPGTWEFLLERNLVSKRLLDVFQTCDELSLIKEVSQERFENLVKELITQLQKELEENVDLNWRVSWSHKD